MQARDIDAVCALADLCHPDLLESAAVLAEKQRLAPHYCFSLRSAESGALSGYLLAHPWAKGQIPALNRKLGALPLLPDTLYLHDLALAENARGFGLAAAALQRLEAAARQGGFAFISLTAVHNSTPFWQKRGFAAARSAADNLAAYGDDAVFMMKALPV